MARETPTGNENDAAAVLTTREPEPRASAEAEESGGAKLIRTSHRGDRYQFDSETEVTGDFQPFPAKKAKAIIERAKASGVRLAVADVEQKG